MECMPMCYMYCALPVDVQLGFESRLVTLGSSFGLTDRGQGGMATGDMK